MIEKERLDKLLNAYMDGELDQRRQTEVKRLLKHDEYVSNRLRQLEKCRQLVATLPLEEAPVGIIEDIKQRIENQARPAIVYQQYDRVEGAKYLMVRKLLSVAAMVALAAVLGGVVYTIVAPNSGSQSPIIAQSQPEPQLPVETDTTVAAVTTDKTEPVETAPVKPVEPAKPQQQIFTATLELGTVNERQVNAFLQRAIADNRLVQLQLPVVQQDRIYAITGSSEGLSILLADLAGIWNQFNSASLYVETGLIGQKVIVSNVTAQQIDKIAVQQNTDSIVAAAKDFAALNRISRPLATEQLVAAMPGEQIYLMPIPKPALTSNRTEPKPTSDYTTQEFSFTIVISGAD